MRTLSNFLLCGIFTIFPQSLFSLSPSKPPNLAKSRDIKERLQLLDQQPLVITNVGPVELLQRVDARAADQRVERVLLLEVATVGRLMGAHLDLDGHGWLAFLAD